MQQELDKEMGLENKDLELEMGNLLFLEQQSKEMANYIKQSKTTPKPKLKQTNRSKSKEKVNQTEKNRKPIASKSGESDSNTPSSVTTAATNLATPGSPRGTFTTTRHRVHGRKRTRRVRQKRWCSEEPEETKNER